MHSFGDQKIDEDHDRIICEFDELCRLIARDRFDVHGHHAWAQRFLRYTSEHFRREEALMRRLSFAGLREHTLAHAYMQREFREHLRTLRPGAPNLRASLEVVRRMFLAHIVTYDEAFGIWQAALRAPAGPGPGRTLNDPAPAPAWTSATPAMGHGASAPLPRIPLPPRSGARGRPGHGNRAGRSGVGSRG